MSGIKVAVSIAVGLAVLFLFVVAIIPSRSVSIEETGGRCVQTTTTSVLLGGLEIRSNEVVIDCNEEEQ